MSKLFISLPMRGYTPDQIRAEMDWMKEIFDDNMNDEFEMIDSIFTELPPNEVIRDSTWYLGKSIAAMAEADVVLFHPNWREARGCLIEHMICALYEIPYIELAHGPEVAEDIETEKETDLNAGSQEKLTLV